MLSRAITAWIRAAAVTLVVVVPLIITPWGLDAYSRPKVLVLYALAGAILAGWLALAPVRRPARRLTAPELPLWAFLAAVLLSTATSAAPRLTFFGAPGRHEGLLAIACYALLFLAGAHFFGSVGRVRQLMSGVTAASVGAAAYGVIQVFAPPLFAGEALVRSWYGTLGIPRVASTLGSPIVFGGYLAFVLPLVLAATLTADRRMRTLGPGLVWLLVLATTLTMTRAAWLAALVGIGVFFAAAGPRARDRSRHVVAVLAVAVVAAVLFSVAVVATPRQMGARVTSVVSTASSSFIQRVYIWERTLGLIRARPLWGWGLETLREVFPYDRASLVPVFGRRPIIIDKAHNDVLQVAVSVGIPGALAYIAMWGAILFDAVRLVRRTTGVERIIAAGALAAVTAYLMQVQFSFSTVALTPIVWLTAGAACGWGAAPPDHGSPAARQHELGEGGTL